MLKMNSRLGNYMNDDGFYKASNMFIGVDMCDSGQVLARQKFFIDKVHGYVKNNHCFLDAKVWEFVKSKKCHVEYYLFNQFYTFGALNKNAVGFLVDSENGIYASVVRCENFQKLANFIPHPTHTARLSYLFAKITGEIARFYNDSDVFKDDWLYFDDFHDFILGDFFLEHCNKDHLLRAIEIAANVVIARCKEFNSYKFKILGEEI